MDLMTYSFEMYENYIHDSVRLLKTLQWGILFLKFTHSALYA